MSYSTLAPASIFDFFHKLLIALESGSDFSEIVARRQPEADHAFMHTPKVDGRARWKKRFAPLLSRAMSARLPWKLIQAALFALAVIAACSDRDDALAPGAAGEAGAAPGGMGPEAAAGDSSAEQAGSGNGQFAGNSSMGGMSTTPQSGGAPNAGQAPSNDAGMPPFEVGGAGGTPGNGLEQLGLCPRLAQRPVLSSRFALNFDRAVYNDPCIGWTTKLYEVTQNRPEYLSALTAWSLGFWGCKEVGVEGFALLWKQPEVLTAGDAKRLIAYYILVLNLELKSLDQAELSPKEEEEMSAALERLSETMVTDSTLDYSHSECLDPPGGGGAGGEGSGGAPLGIAGEGGHGGQPQ